MPKKGILHDYDLMANLEPSAQSNVCVICGADLIRYQWSDYSGEAMCMECGAPYQLKWGSDKQKEEGAYPYMNLKKEWLPIIREYWNEAHCFTCLGTMLGGPNPGLAEFNAWVIKHYPEKCKKEEEK